MIDKFKIDNHIIETYLINNFLIKIYYNYNNNYNCLSFIYSIKEEKFYGSDNLIDNILTKRQQKILIDKIKKIYKNEIWRSPII